ncbi:unnamed protein product [Phytophthora fragariaefolia]|uniref:Unnamed protein product n=1 Tax=Phytophthora fragariaefolia TaxID=1490495 RepID=A0A9W6XPC8_9STRA|nr:unnamed protein product [Phytophthora fragariaefolia]
MKRRGVGLKQPLLYEEEAAFEYAAGAWRGREGGEPHAPCSSVLSVVRARSLSVRAGKGGNLDAAEEILERGVNNDALTAAQKDELLKRIVAGRAGWVAAFSGSPQEQKVLALRSRMQALRRAQDMARSEDGPAARSAGILATTPRGLTGHATTPRHAPMATADTTPSNQNRGREDIASAPPHTPSNAIDVLNTTPVSHDRQGLGFPSTVSKVPRNGNKSPLLTTPSLSTRSSLKSQSTSRKTHHPPLRFSTLGMEVAPDKHKSLMIKSEKKTKTKIDVGEIAHILSWDPKKTKSLQTSTDPAEKQTGAGIPSPNSVAEVSPENDAPVPALKTTKVASQQERNPVAVPAKVDAFKSKTAAPEQKYPPEAQIPVDMVMGARIPKTSIVERVEHYRSPKRLQLDPSLAVDMSSPSSVSSSSSPPIAAMVNTSSRDALESLTSRVVVRPKLFFLSRQILLMILAVIQVNGQKYIKLEQIGSGGSSKVYRMLGPDLKIYALKKIKLKKLDSLSIAQYTNEINLLKKLQGNPHIIKLITAEQDLKQRQINVIMEHGEIDLSERLRNLKGGMDENLLRVIWTQMLQAVDAIHSQRIIHGEFSDMFLSVLVYSQYCFSPGDLKPANFLFVNGALKLIDFGIAKTISNDTTNIERDSQIGTVNFMSPEAIQGNTLPDGQRDPEGKMKVRLKLCRCKVQFLHLLTSHTYMNDQVGRASDIWSLGCILYQIVYSKPPFADVHSIIEKFRCIIDPSVSIPFPALKNKDLEDVMRSCLQRDHRCRPSINGDDGLLNHPFLRSAGTNTVVPSTPTVTLENAPQVLTQLGDLLRSQGVATSHVNMFMSIGEAGLRASTGEVFHTHRYLYNTQERQTDI